MIVSIVTVVMVADISTTLRVLVTVVAVVVVSVIVDDFIEFVDCSINFNEELNGGILVVNAAVLVG